MVKIIILVVFSSLVSHAHDSYISRTQSLSEDGYEISFINSYFKTSSLVFSDGKVEALEEGESYQTVNSTLGFKYAPTSNLEVFTSVRFRLNQSSELINSVSESFSVSGTESFFIGINYGSGRTEGYQYMLKAIYRQSLYSNDYFDVLPSTESIALGDGGVGLLFGLGLSYISKDNNYYEFDIDFRNPSNRLSSEVKLDTRVSIAWRPISFIFGLEYLASLGEDQFGNNPSDKEQLSSGSTNLYNSINRTYAEPYAGVNLRLSSTWRLESRFAQRVSGKSTDLGMRGELSLIKRVSNSNNFQNKNNSFKQYEIEGIVTKITKSRKAVIVDQGVSAGLKKGDRVDFYHFDFVDGDELIAAGVVIKSSYDKAIVKVMKRYSKRKIKDGTVIRAGLIR